MASVEVDQATGYSKAAAISTMAVRALHEYTGRGPTRARTHITDDAVTILLEDILTKGERSLVTDGLAATVLETRKAFQGAMRDDLISAVEEVLGRRVTAFLSDNHIDPDLAVEVFLLAPPDA